MNAKTFADAVQKISMPGRSLLLPMLLLALGIHAALLALPIPSGGAVKEAEDKKNPITVSQIPTEQPTATRQTRVTAKVNIPALPTAATGSEPSPAAALDTAAVTTPPAAPSVSPAPSQRSPSRTPSATSPTDTPASSEPTTEPATTVPEPVATTTAAASSPANPFADFPHWQPSEADCYGLGFGENCRVVNQGTIAQVTDYFKKELAAKDFTATLVTDEPTRKVFKVTKGDKTLFLNLWQGADQVSYLLSRVVVKQAPADIKTDAGK